MIINFEHQMEQILTHHSSQIQCGGEKNVCLMSVSMFLHL